MIGASSKHQTAHVTAAYMQTMPSFWKPVHYRANAPFTTRASRKDETQPPDEHAKKGG
jgi:hypothetical protein